MFRLVLASMFAFPAIAQAEETTSADTSNGFYSIDETWLDQPELNIQACTNGVGLAAPLTVRLIRTTAPLIPTESNLQIWWVTASDTECTGQIPTSTDDYVGVIDMDAGDAFLTGNESVDIPTDLDDEIELTDYSILLDRGACTEPGEVIPIQEDLTLCFGLDEDKDGSIQATATYETPAEPHGWVRLRLDTDAPPEPSAPEVLPLDGRLSVTSRISDEADPGDIAIWHLMRRQAPDDGTVGATPCDQWTSDEVGIAFASVEEPSAGPVTIGVSGQNGVTYELCVWAEDTAGNEGPFSTVASGTAQQECDFIECYPGKLKTGYCGAADGSGWFTLLTLVLMGCTRRRRTVQMEQR